jgi:hypothetical protein
MPHLAWTYLRAIATTNAGDDTAKQKPYTLLVAM